MQNQPAITVQELCVHYSVDPSILFSLKEHGLINISGEEDKQFISLEELSFIEKILRLHQELNINLEGIDTIFHLLQKLDEQHHEILLLKNRLSFFEQ